MVFKLLIRSGLALSFCAPLLLGQQGFGTAHTIDQGYQGTSKLWPLDFDGDGDIDLLLTPSTLSDSHLQWYENLGGGTFSPTAILGDPIIGVISVEDLDNDGDFELIAQNGDELTWHENLGGALFGPQELLGNLAGGGSVTTADLNGDGYLDCIATSGSFFSPPTEIVWFQNLTNGQFAAGQVIASPKSGTIDSFEAADISGDSVADIVMDTRSGLAQSSISWIENLGAGAFGETQIISEQDASWVRAIDCDGDRDQDVRFASGPVSGIWASEYLAENLGESNFDVHSLGIGTTILGLENYFFDSDSDLDTDRIARFQWTDPATLVPSSALFYHEVEDCETVFSQALTSTGLFMGVGDLDGDGDQDAVIFEPEAGLLWRENLSAQDCNANGISDWDEIADDPTLDCNKNGSLDSCELADPTLDVNHDGVLDACEPTLLGLTISESAWYETVAIELIGSNFDMLGSPALTIGSAMPLPISVQSSEIGSVEIPPNFFDESGTLDVTFNQGNWSNILLDGFTVLPALESTLTGTAAAGGSISFQVSSKQGGVAYLLVADSNSPVPLAFTDIHAALGLDPLTVSILTTGGLIVEPTAIVPFPPGLLPQGTTAAVQGLALEFGLGGTFYSFTNTIEVMIP